MTDIFEIWVCGSPFTEFEKVRASTEENEDVTKNNTQEEGACQIWDIQLKTWSTINY